MQAFSRTASHFRVWAPRCRSVDVVVDGRAIEALSAREGGLFDVTLEGLAEGARYKYRLDATRYGPDPASRFQPEGVHGPSVVVDPARFVWTDQEFCRSRARRARLLRAPRRRVHAGGHVRGDHSAPGPPGRARRHRDRADADRRVPGLAQLGLRRRASVGAAIDLRRAARSAAPRRRLPRAGPVGHPRRRLQPPRPRGQLSRRVRPVLRRPHARPPGAPRSTTTARAPRACAVT